MRDILSDLSDAMSDPDPVRRAQIQMKRPLPKRFYKEVSTDKAEEGFRILLDGRPVRTRALDLEGELARRGIPMPREKDPRSV